MEITSQREYVLAVTKYNEMWAEYNRQKKQGVSEEELQKLVAGSGEIIDAISYVNDNCCGHDGHNQLYASKMATITIDLFDGDRFNHASDYERALAFDPYLNGTIKSVVIGKIEETVERLDKFGTEKELNEAVAEIITHWNKVSGNNIAVDNHEWYLHIVGSFDEHSHLSASISVAKLKNTLCAIIFGNSANGRLIYNNEVLDNLCYSTHMICPEFKKIMKQKEE